MPGKNTGAPLNSNLMRKLVGKAQGVDTSHIQVSADTKDTGSGLKPTREEFEKWQRGEGIVEGVSKPTAPVIDLGARTKSTMKSLLEKQQGGTTAPTPKVPSAGLQTQVYGEDMDFKYNPSAPIPDLSRSYQKAVEKVSGRSTPNRQAQSAKPSDLPVPSTAGGGVALVASVNEETISDELPVKQLKRMLIDLGEAMIENAGGKYGVADVFPFNGTTYDITFQHRLHESSGDTGLQIEVKLQPTSAISTASVSVTLSESSAVSQTVSRNYLNPAELINDLSNLIEAAGQYV